MHENDFRPDLEGEQTMDIYTSASSRRLMPRTCSEDGGGGRRALLLRRRGGLKSALVAALLDIIEKTQSFTASTVPASRTQDGADFYTSFFLPLGADPFWQGHLQAYHITGTGDIEDANGDCALADSTVGECNSGPFLADAVPFWDAGAEIPAPASRSLYTSKLASSVPTRVAFDTTLAYGDLGLPSFAPTESAGRRAEPHLLRHARAERGGSRGRDRPVRARLRVRDRRADQRRDRRRRGLHQPQLAAGRHLPLQSDRRDPARRVHRRAQLPGLQDELRDARPPHLRGLQRRLPARSTRD
jgi:hypothetical protein